MHIKFKCANPACKQKLSVDHSFVGSAIVCPVCFMEVIVPTGEVPESANKWKSDWNRSYLSALVVGLGRRINLFVRPALFLTICLVACGAAYRTVLPMLPPAVATKPVNEAMYAVPQFRKAPLMSPDGKQVLLATVEEKGVAIGLLDLATHECKTLVKLDTVDQGQNYFRLLGWSTEGRFLAYSCQTDADSINEEIVIWDGLGKHFITSWVLSGYLENFVWIAEGKCLVTQNDGKHFICTVEAAETEGGRKASQTVSVPTDFKLFGGKLVDGRHLFGSRSNMVYECELRDERVSAVKELGRKSDFDFRSKTSNNRYIALCEDKATGKRSRWVAVEFDQAGRRIEKTLFSQEMEVLTWFYREESGDFVYVSNEKGNYSLVIANVQKKSVKRLFQGGQVHSLGAGPNGTFIALAAEANEPLSLWKITVGTTAPQRIWEDDCYRIAKENAVKPITGAVKVDGEHLTYFILPPKHFKKDRLYPVIIDGPATQKWRQFPQFLAQNDIFYVSVSFRLEPDHSRRNSTADLLAIRQRISEHPNIDTNRIYLMGVSANTVEAVKAAERYPSLWHGLILINPVRLPEFSRFSGDNPSVLIVAGDRESLAPVLSNFEHRAFQTDVGVTLQLVPGAGHIFNTLEANKVRDRLVWQFVNQKFKQ